MDPQFLEPNFFVDADHPAVIEYARAHTDLEATAKQNAVRLFLSIRDEFRYNPYGVGFTREAFKASTLLLRDRDLGGHCIDKANLLCACGRVVGIPSRLHFANVRNHIAAGQLQQALGTDLLVFHGYTELFINDRWVAATPAFNKELCEHLDVAPLDWDGENDAIFQEFDQHGGRFMDYAHDYGAFAEIPFALMLSEWKRYYPSVRDGSWPSGPA